MRTRTHPDPVLWFCPYLPLLEPVTCGNWRLGPVTAFDAEWGDAEFRERALSFLAHFRDAEGNPIARPTLLAHSDYGLRGCAPRAGQMEDLHARIQFAALDRNPRFTPEASASDVITADNCDLYVWPIDVDDGSVVVVRGSMMWSKTTGGMRIGDQKLTIAAPLEVHVPRPITIEAGLMAAADHVFSVPGHAHLRTAADWHGKAWKKMPSVTPADRVVLLKTGFEALTSTSNSAHSARRLRQLFQRLDAETIDEEDELLWSPAEVPRHERRWTDREGLEHIDILTDLEHWFMAFADTRNDIIHRGAIPSLLYDLNASPYRGHFVWTGEWLLRTAIKIEMAGQGYRDLWRPGPRGAADRARAEVVRKAVEAYHTKQNAVDDGETTDDESDS
jgi:hypothetical protein